MMTIQTKWCLFLLGAFMLFGPGSLAMESEAPQELKKGEPSMNLGKNLPLIDVAVPSKFETASFGLG